MEQEQVAVSMPGIGDKAPEFKAVTTQGEINFPGDYAGEWVILFSHPADFTPADWRPGDDVIIGPAGSCGSAKNRMDGKEDMVCRDWFFRSRKLTKKRC